jgi:hypothetical protein
MAVPPDCGPTTFPCPSEDAGDAEACTQQGCSGACRESYHYVYPVIDGCVVCRCAPDDDAGDGSTEASSGADACAGMSECCGFGPAQQGLSCEQDYGPAVCGSNGWACPSGGSPAPGCSMLCTDIPDAAPDTTPAGGAGGGK